MRLSFVGNPAIEALGRKHAEFGLRQIKPADVLWSVVPFEALDQSPGFHGRKSFVERRFAVDVEIVLDQNDGLDVGEVAIGQFFQDLGIVHGGMAIGDFDMAPAFERCKHHEDVDAAVALVLIIAASRASWFHRDRSPRLGEKLFGSLAQAHQRAIGLVWPRVDLKHIFHGGYERAIGFRWDDPALSAMGLENVFFRTRPIVESLA